MADWVTITDSQVDPDAPLTSDLAYAWRDNPVAAFEGAVGAPRLADGAFNPSATATAPLATWIGNRYGLISAGAIGSLAFAARASGGTTAFGNTIAGSSLTPVNAAGTTSGSTLTGTWRSLGWAAGGGGEAGSTLWQRIS